MHNDSREPSIVDDYKQILKGFDIKVRMTVENEIEKRMKEVLRKREDDLDQRRQRLKDLYEQGDIEARAVLHSAIKSEDNVIESMERKILEVELAKERERKELAEKKIAQLKFLNNEQIRTILSHQQDLSIRKDQVWQIGEKMKASEQRAKEEQFYHQLIIQNAREAMTLESDNLAKKWQKQVEVKNGYREQIEEKTKFKLEAQRKLDEDRLQRELRIEEVKAEQEKELNERKKKMNALDAEMKKMIEIERENRQKRRCEERAMAHEIELIASGNKGLSKEDLKKELDSYKIFLERLTEKMRNEEKLFDQKLAEVVKEREQHQADEKKRLQSAKDHLITSVLQGREDQLKKKVETQKFEHELKLCERQKLKKDMDDFFMARNKEREDEMEKKRQYALELRQQMQEKNILQEKEKQLKQREIEADMAARVRMENELKELAGNPPQWNQHPLRGVQLAAHCIPPSS